jgi:hypothetical protein
VTEARGPEPAGSAHIEILAWSGCPSYEEAHARLVALLGELGRPDVVVETRWIETDAEAAETGFIGSPTFRWLGADLLPVEAPSPVGLACRVYRRRDGRISPLPDPDDLREAVERVLIAAPADAAAPGSSPRPT